MSGDEMETMDDLFASDPEEELVNGDTADSTEMTFDDIPASQVVQLPTEATQPDDFESAFADLDESDLESPRNTKNDDYYDPIDEQLFGSEKKPNNENRGNNEQKLNHFEETLNRLKKRTRNREVSAATAQEKMVNLVNDMEVACESDWGANRRGEPAMHKMVMLPSLCATLKKTQWKEWFVTSGGCLALAHWFNPLPDGARPNLTLRTELLKIIAELPISSNALRDSGLGKIVKGIYADKSESQDNRSRAQMLIQRWIRGIFGQTTSYARQRSEMQSQLEDQIQETVPKKPKTQQQIQEEQDEINSRRHPQMFGKPDLQFKVQPRTQVSSAKIKVDAGKSQYKIAKSIERLRGPSTKSKCSKHEKVSISGNGMNLVFK